MKDNLDRLLEAVEHPERFSDEELDILFNDTETKELYDTMAKSSELLAPTPDPDIDLEWDRFAAAHRKKKLIRLPFSRHAAAAAVIAVIASLAMVAATIGIKYTMEHPSTPEPEVQLPTVSTEGAAVGDNTVQESDSPDSLPYPEIKVFKDETLEHIIYAICEYYGASASFKSQTARKLRLYFKWDQSQQLDEVVDQLNSFEQIEIELGNNVITVE